jgi:hypothetical protein
MEWLEQENVPFRGVAPREGGRAKSRRTRPPAIKNAVDGDVCETMVSYAEHKLQPQDAP